MDPDLAQAIAQNTRRYVAIFSDVVSELLPVYKQREVMAKDALDVYIEHRLLLRQQHHGNAPLTDPRNTYPPELIRRL